MFDAVVHCFREPRLVDQLGSLPSISLSTKLKVKQRPLSMLLHLLLSMWMTSSPSLLCECRTVHPCTGITEQQVHVMQSLVEEGADIIIEALHSHHTVQHFVTQFALQLLCMPYCVTELTSALQLDAHKKTSYAKCTC
jgi:hypothetical protein